MPIFLMANRKNVIKWHYVKQTVKTRKPIEFPRKVTDVLW